MSIKDQDYNYGGKVGDWHIAYIGSGDPGQTVIPSSWPAEPKGWQCPQCKTVYAPWVAHCPCSKQTTYSGSTNK